MTAEWTQIFIAALGSGGTVASLFGGYWLVQRSKQEAKAAQSAKNADRDALERQRLDERVSAWVDDTREELQAVKDELAQTRVQFKTDTDEMYSSLIESRNRESMWFQAYQRLAGLYAAQGGTAPALPEQLLRWPAPTPRAPVTPQ